MTRGLSPRLWSNSLCLHQLSWETLWLSSALLPPRGRTTVTSAKGNPVCTGSNLDQDHLTLLPYTWMETGGVNVRIVLGLRLLHRAVSTLSPRTMYTALIDIRIYWLDITFGFLACVNNAAILLRCNHPAEWMNIDGAEHSGPFPVKITLNRLLLRPSSNVLVSVIGQRCNESKKFMISF